MRNVNKWKERRRQTLTPCEVNMWSMNYLSSDIKISKCQNSFQIFIIFLHEKKTDHKYASIKPGEMYFKINVSHGPVINFPDTSLESD